MSSLQTFKTTMAAYKAELTPGLKTAVMSAAKQLVSDISKQLDRAAILSYEIDDEFDKYEGAYFLDKPTRPEELKAKLTMWFTGFDQRVIDDLRKIYEDADERDGLSVDVLNDLDAAVVIAERIDQLNLKPFYTNSDVSSLVPASRRYDARKMKSALVNMKIKGAFFEHLSRKGADLEVTEMSTLMK